MIAVADVGQLLCQFVVVIALAEAEGGQCDAILALDLDHLLQRVDAGGADVEVAVGGQHHAVHAAVDEVIA
ncbi:MAG: hypothetical protein KDI78_13790, partial [Xanthomonadales bacterium]|nr:hypothetical protein [Xanthomonadales bacterium]